MMDKNSGKGPAKKMAATLLKEESFRVESWLRYQQECLQKTMEEMDEEAFERAAGAVAGAAGSLFTRKTPREPWENCSFFGCAEAVSM